MARQIQIRRGTATEHNSFTGAIGEITMDTTNNTLRVHDGQTVGGTILARESIISKMAAPSDTATVLDLSPDTKWTSPNNGYISIYGTSTASNQGLWLALQNASGTTLMYSDAFSSASDQRLTVNLPIAAGQKFFYSTTSLTNVVVHFIKSHGES